MKTALVTDGKYRSSIAAVRALHRAGYRVVVTQTRADVKSAPAVSVSKSCDDFRWIDGACADADYAEKLLSVLKEYEYPVLFCVGAVTLNTVAARREEFAALRAKYDAEIAELQARSESLAKQRELAEKQQELAEEIRRTVEELVDGVEYEDAFYRQLLDKMVVHDRNHVDVYLKFLPEKWSYAIAKASETAEAADCGIVETSVPISVSKPDTRG